MSTDAIAIEPVSNIASTPRPDGNPLTTETEARRADLVHNLFCVHQLLDQYDGDPAGLGDLVLRRNPLQAMMPPRLSQMNSF